MKFITCLFFFTLFHSSLYSQNFDIDFLNKINSPPNDVKDKKWIFLTNTTSPVSIATPVTMFITGLSIDDNELKNNSYKAGASFILSNVFTHGLKIIIKRERPYTTYSDIIYPKGYYSGFSFPSGHTTAAFATATSLSLSFPKWYVIIPSYTYAAAVAYSRMYLGVHYLTDILAGIISGVGITLLTFEAGKRIEENN